MPELFELTALTPIHIGSGRVLYQNQGFSFRSRTQELVFDPTIHAREPLPVSRGMKEERELRLHLEDGTGRLLLPGSSLKGALKTLWISEQLHQGHYSSEAHAANVEAARNALADQTRHLPLLLDDGRYQKPKVNDKALMEAVLDGSFDTDAWQRLRVGDASFTQARAYRVSIGNHIIGRGSRQWGEKDQHWLIETIAAKSQSRVRIDWPWFSPNDHSHPWENGKGVTPPGKRPPDPAALLAACRSASLRILQAELREWDRREGAEWMYPYIDRLQEISDQLRGLGPDACILRIGYGSGFDGITGRISRLALKGEGNWEGLFQALRGKHYNGPVPLPKTRKFAGNHYPFGFVHLRWLHS